MDGFLHALLSEFVLLAHRNLATGLEAIVATGAIAGMIQLIRWIQLAMGFKGQNDAAPASLPKPR